MFSRKRHWISWTCFRPDPTRPDPDLGAQFSYPIPRPTPLRPDLTLKNADAPCWALPISLGWLSRLGQHNSYIEVSRF